jgi:uncharacterized surface protein with fasciclin (FAS1) repeats
MKFCFWPRHSAWVLTALLMALLIVPAAAAAKQKGPKIRDIADSVATNPILTKFASMLQASGLDTFLSSKGPFTVFAPTDSAFARLPPYTLEILLQPQNKDRLQAIVLYHVVNNKRLTALDLKAQKAVLTCQGGELTVKLSKLGTQFVQKAKITHADIKCANGVINEVDAVLMPPEGTLPPLAAPIAPGAEASTNAATDNSNAPPPATNATTADTNGPPVVPVAPVATPDGAAHR